MLTRNCKKLLNTINKLHSLGIYYPNMSELKNAISFDEKEIMLTASYLKDNGYIHVDFGDGDTILLIESKFKGKNYKELIWKERKTFLFRSIIVPIAVSLASSTLFWLIK